MSSGFSFSRFYSCYFCLLLFMASLHLCLSNTSSNAMLCMDDERQELLQFKHGLIDGAGRLASWVREENSDCCKWAGVVCDNVTGHVHKIHLPCNCRIDSYATVKSYEECLKQKLRGELSPSLLNLKQLRHLDLSHNDFGGKQVPKFIGSLMNLRYLNLSRSSFGGTIPPQLGNLSELRILSLGSFHDQYESYSMMNMQWLSGLRFLYHLDMSGINLSKAVDWLQISFLDLSYNSFVGLLHHLICPYGGKQLQLLNLASNHLSGAIPNQFWEKYPNLAFLNLENNNLSGGIPRTLGSLSSMRSLNMCNNKLSGRLPTSLKNLTELSILQLARNKLTGRIPTWLGTELSTLSILNLRSNSFQRTITHELCYLTRIQILDLAHNNLSGNIPRCFNNFTILSGKKAFLDNFIFLYFEDTGFLSSASLVIKGREDIYSTILGFVMIVDLSSNNFSRNIPSELMALRVLNSLNLSRNQLTGSIPEKIGDMKSLESFDVSFNRLSGELPVSLSSLSFLNSFNVSYNDFTGRVPTSTQLQSFDESSFFGNKLCGAPLNESCVVAVPDANHEEEEEDGSHGTDWGLIISMVSGFIVGFWVAVVPLIVSTTWRIAYFGFLRDLRYMVCDVIRKHLCNMFRK